ncbi:MAG: phosphatidate cytidylyltransferase [Rickettsiaceae bacterium]|jgi:phosphatidate cytidylyltransferase|nr:phosphatidate cytidylyltransferase [Rickettsiaceae bacterium]
MELPKISISENLQKRIISAGILAPIVLLIIWRGGALYSTMVVLVTVIMSFEWCGIVTSPNKPIGHEERRKWMNYGVVYVAVFAASLLYLRSLDGGFGVVIIMLLIVWATDIAAFFTGRLLQGPKIYPAISPNKTWSGLAGGMAAAGLVGGFASIFINSSGFFSMVIFAAFLAVIAQAGDFLESAIKRKFGVKDSGTLIPGHGGLMDRLDGFTTVAPVFAIIAVLKGGTFLQ